MEWEQVVPGYEFSYDVHFLHSDDPRHGFTVMSMNPETYFEFRTPIGFLETHTIVRVDLPPSNPSRPFLFPLKRPATDQLTLSHDLGTTRW